MPIPSWSLDSSLTRNPSLFERIRENFVSVWALRHVAPATGPQLHFLEKPAETKVWRAQLSSTAVHVICGLLLIYLFAYHKADLLVISSVPVTRYPDPLRYVPPQRIAGLQVTPSLGRAGNGGGHNPLPPTAGNLAPLARFVFAPPRLPDGQQHSLPVSSAILDREAPEIPKPVNDLGLPWMSDKNDSEGTGKHGIGTGPGSTMGDRDGNSAGVGHQNLPYAALASQVVCRLCPDPIYSDEARKQKLQGRVIMRVLVGADGRAQDVQVTRGLGLGLDENAERAVRGWQFIPARDVARRPVATWITIETVFRLF